jgi:hypothetical protein
MAFGGLIGRTDKLAAKYAAAGRESASARASRLAGTAPTPEQLAEAAEQVAATPDSATRRRGHRTSGADRAAHQGQAWDDTDRGRPSGGAR